MWLALAAGWLIASLTLGVGGVGAEAPAESAGEAKEAHGPIHELRIYEIFNSNKAAFHKRFRDDAIRIMARYDFKIVAIWESTDGPRTEFVYLLEWPDRDTMKDRWTRFRADKEWIEVKRVTSARDGVLVGDIEDRVLELTDYSPRRSLAK